MGTREGMIQKCESFLGTVGRPNTATRWYAARNGSWFANAAWCNMYITWAAYHSGNYQDVCFGTDYAYTVYHAQRFQRADQWHVDTAGIQRGDIVFFDWGGTNSVSRIDHIGIVTGVSGGNVLTIEGNTSDRCARRVREASTIVGYGRPDYDDNVPPPADDAQRTYTVVAGDSLWSISREFNCLVADLRKWNQVGDLIVPGEVLKVSAPAAAYVPPPFPAGLAPNRASPSAQPLQKALKAAGYMPEGVVLADNYGPQTQKAVIDFHRANPAYASGFTDPVIGPLGWAQLHREAYGD